MKKNFVINFEDFLRVSSEEASQMIGGSGTEAIPPFTPPSSTQPSDTFTVDLGFPKRDSGFPYSGFTPGGGVNVGGNNSNGMGNGTSFSFPFSTPSVGIAFPTNGFGVTPTQSISADIDFSKSGVTASVTANIGNLGVTASATVGLNGKVSGIGFTGVLKF